MSEIVLADAAINYGRAPLASRQAYVGQLAFAGQLLPRTVRDGAPTPDQRAAAAFYLAEVGAMMGIHPLEAMSGIHLIEGRPTISAGLMSALIRKAGHKLRVSESGQWQQRDYVARVVIIRADDPEFEHVAEFGYEDASMAGLANKKGPWQQYPKAMCKARAISACARAAAEDALGGARYTPEELGANVNDEGEPINLGHVDAYPERQQQQQQQPAPAPAAQPTPAPAPAAAPVPETATAPTVARPAAQVTDEQIIDSIPTEVVQHSAAAWKAHAAADHAELLGIWNSAKAARIMNHAALSFNDLGQPTVYGRDEQGAPVPLGAMLRTLGEGARAAAATPEPVAAPEPAAEPAEPHPSVRTVAAQDDDPNVVDAEVVGEGGGNDPEAA